ncbi:MAG: acetyl-CoA acetyltransferase [Xanthobacteraceae bacterium]
MSQDVFVLGGYQTDFAKNYSRDNKDIAALMEEAVEGGLEKTKIEAREIETAHVGNFAGELFCNQGILGGVFAAIRPEFNGLPSGRHEAACASGSLAVLGAAAEIEAGRYGLACVLGFEYMRNVSGKQAGEYLAVAARTGHEFRDATYVWPRAFSDLTEVYDERYGVDYRHVARIAEINLENGKRNPNAQTRKWIYTPKSFSEDDEANPRIEGRVRRNDCAQVTDGASAIFLASREYAEEWAKRNGIDIASVPRILGWGHRSATILFKDKMAYSKDKPYVFPHVRGTIEDAFGRAGVKDVFELDAIETHDCFAITEYMAIDHFGITAPGEAWKAVEDNTIALGGKLPVNPSGGLIGLGHPVGATGVRMVLDAHKQVTGDAGGYQVEGASKVATLNIGGTTTTSCCFIVGA